MSTNIFDMIHDAINHRARNPTEDQSEHPEDVARLEQPLRANPGLVHDREEFTESTPLHLAAAGHVPAIAEMLLRHGAAVNALAQGLPPLHSSISTDAEEMDPMVRVVEVLIRHGAEVNFRNPYGQTLLEIASTTVKDRVAELLRAAGAR